MLVGNLSTPTSEVVALVPECIARENRIVPLATLDSTLIVGCDRDFTQALRDKLRFILQRDVHAVRRPASWVDSALDTSYAALYESHDADTESPDTTWYWIGWHSFDDDGTLVIKTSGWDSECRWNGAADFAPTDPDYDFWCWVVSIPQYNEMIDSEQIPKLRRIWNRYLDRSPTKHGRRAESPSA